jgi:hypothetical protein
MGWLYSLGLPSEKFKLTYASLGVQDEVFGAKDAYMIVFMVTGAKLTVRSYMARA